MTKRPDKHLPAPTSIRFPPDIKKKLLAQALARRQPLSNLVVWIVENWLQYKEK